MTPPTSPTRTPQTAGDSSREAMPSLIEAISKRRRLALDRSDTWTAEQALEAVLYDLKTGAIKPAALVIVYAIETPTGGHEVSYRLANDTPEGTTFWLAGMLHKAAADLLDGEE